MAGYRNDGKPVKHKGGRPTKAEEMGLDKKMAKAFKNVTNGRPGYGSTKVIEEMWKIALDNDNAKRFEALKWITDRYYGKEPKAIIQETKITTNEFSPEEILKQAYEQDQDQSDIQADTNE